MTGLLVLKYLSMYKCLKATYIFIGPNIYIIDEKDRLRWRSLSV